RLKKLKTRISLGGSMMFFRNVNFVNTERNDIGNISVTPRLGAYFDYKDKLSINGEARLGFNSVHYTLQPALNVDYWRQVVELEVNWDVWRGLHLRSEISYTKYTGRSNGFNQDPLLWNAAVSKSFLKSKKAEVKFSVFDLLNQNVGISRNANLNFVEDQSYNVLKRYFLLSFTYSLN